MKEYKKPITNPKISICQRGKTCFIGCFNEFDCIKGFKEYDDEETGIKEARDFFKDKTDLEIKIVRPKLTKIKYS